MSDRKSIWLPRVPRTGSTYVLSRLHDAAIENDWKIFKKDQPETEVESRLTDHSCIYTGHDSYYSDRMKDWVKLLVVRRDVIGRFISCFNYSNYLLNRNSKRTLDIDTFIHCHRNWFDDDVQEIVKENRRCWNPYTDTCSYIRHIQEKSNQTMIVDIIGFFDKIYFTENIDNLLHDIEYVYGYSLNRNSDWVDPKLQNFKNASFDFPHVNPIRVTDLSEDQLNRIMHISTIQKEYIFLELLASKLK